MIADLMRTVGRRPAAAAWIVFASSVVIRLAVLAVAPSPFENYYLRQAEALGAGDGFSLDGVSSTVVEPAYPVFLALARAVTGASVIGVMLAQILVLSLGGVALHRLTLRLTGRPGAALAAGLIYAAYPYLARQAVSYSDAPFGAALLSAALLAFVVIRRPRHAAIAGMVMGCLVLTRFSYAPLAFAALPLVWRRCGTRHGVAFAAALAALVCPWLLRTHAIDGGWLPSRVGMNLYISTCEYADQIGRYDTDVLLPDIYERRYPELDDSTPAGFRARDRRMFEDGMRCAGAAPMRTLRLKAQHALRVLSPRLMPYHPRGTNGHAEWVDGRLEPRDMGTRSRTERWIHEGATLLLFVASAAGLWLRRRQFDRDAILLITIAAFVVVNGLFVVSTRLVSPMYVVLMVYAGAATASRASRTCATERASTYRHSPN